MSLKVLILLERILTSVKVQDTFPRPFLFEILKLWFLFDILYSGVLHGLHFTPLGFKLTNLYMYHKL